MPKLTKKLISEYNKTENSIKRSERSHKKVVEDILKNELIQTKLKDEYDSCPGSWRVTGVDLCNDSEMSNTPREFEWVEVTEDEYYELRKKEHGENYWNKSWNGSEDKLKEEYINEPFEIKYFHNREKEYEYLRVYVNETWRYGGYDNTHVDFLLTEIMDEKDLRKEKLEKLEKI